jgi:hypothetical protein
MVKQLVVSFDQPVAVQAGAMRVIDEFGTDHAIDVANPSGDEMTYVITFTGLEADGGSCPDGNFQLICYGGLVTNSAGTAMVDDYTYNDHRLFGDSDGDRDVDRADLIRVRGTYGKSTGEPGFREAYDYDSSGTVDLFDVGELRNRLNAWVPPGTFPPTEAPEADDGDDVAAPAVDYVAINDGGAQRSMVTGATVAFDQDVTLDDDAVTVEAADGGAVAVAVSNPSGDRRTFRVTFSGPRTINGSLADGSYTLRVQAGKVRDQFGRPLAGGDHVTTFHRLFGDRDGDGDVDRADLIGIRGAYGSHRGEANYRLTYDHNNDGVIDMLDVLALRAQIR